MAYTLIFTVSEYPEHPPWYLLNIQNTLHTVSIHAMVSTFFSSFSRPFPISYNQLIMLQKK